MSVDELTATWRHPSERSELVERLIAAERRARVAELRANALTGDTDRVTALAARVVELEQLAERLNEKLRRANGTR